MLAGWMLAACSGGGFQKTENGVVVEVKQQQPTDVRKVRLEVMGEKLIHVSATPEKEFSKEQSLIVIPQQNKTDFKVEEQGDEVTVKTSELHRGTMLFSVSHSYFSSYSGFSSELPSFRTEWGISMRMGKRM